MDEKIKKEVAVSIYTLPNNVNSFWRQGHKRIFLSMSLIHNGHYIVTTFSAYLSTITAHLGSIPLEM